MAHVANAEPQGFAFAARDLIGSGYPRVPAGTTFAASPDQRDT
jgi:hypothetical protein